MSEQVSKHLPVPTPETAPYWEGCRKHELLIQRCDDCGEHQFYPRSVCGKCMSGKLEWVRASGRGRVVSYTVMHRAVSDAYAAEAGDPLVLVDLEEGPRMMSRVVGCDLARLEIGMAVEVVFDDWSKEISIPKFRPLDI